MWFGVLSAMSGLKNFDDFLIPISSLSTFTFCPRRYYLLYVECNDSDYGNGFTELGKISHTTLHDSKIEKGRTLLKHKICRCTLKNYL